MREGGRMKGEKHKTRVVEEASPLSSPRVLHAVRHDAVEPLGERVNLPARPPVPDVVPSVHRGVERVQLKNLESKRCVGAGIFYFIDSRGLSHQTTVGAFTSYGGSNATAVQLPPPPAAMPAAWKSAYMCSKRLQCSWMPCAQIRIAWGVPSGSHDWLFWFVRGDRWETSVGCRVGRW